MNGNSLVPDTDPGISKALDHLASDECELTTSTEIVASFVMSILHYKQVVPLDKARAVLEKHDFSSPKLREIAHRLIEVAALKVMPGELPDPESAESSYLKVALMATSFAQQQDQMDSELSLPERP